MTNLRESGARTEVAPHNTIGVAMEDLPEVERGRSRRKSRRRWPRQGGDGRGEEEEAHVFPKNMHGCDQENHLGHHDYGNCYTYGNS
jgi:hypothetical protein